jgi:nucleoside-diphosphate-sugar epimerase
MKVVVTGATGFVGGQLVKRLSKEGIEVYTIVRPHSDVTRLKEVSTPVVDTGDTETLKAFFEEVKPDGVLHLASLFLAQHEADDIEALVSSNILFGTRLLEAAVASGTHWFINTGTFWQHYNNETYNPVNLYAATKEAFEAMAKLYYETTPLNFATIKLNDTFGPGDTRRKIFNLWRSLDEGESLGMSPGEQIIDMSYIENILDAYMQMIQNLSSENADDFNGKTYCVTANERVTLKEIAKIYEEATGTKLTIVWGERPYRDREVMYPWDKGTPVPGWKQKVSLHEAIQTTIDGESNGQ